jgi:hypothetical protein
MDESVISFGQQVSRRAYFDMITTPIATGLLGYTAARQIPKAASYVVQEVKREDHSFGSVIGSVYRGIGNAMIPVGLASIPFTGSVGLALSGAGLASSTIGNFLQNKTRKDPISEISLEQYLSESGFIRHSKHGSLITQVLEGKVSMDDISPRIQLQIANDLNSKNGMEFMKDLDNKFT